MYNKNDFIVLKEWCTINHKYPYFNNEDNFGEEEIYIKEDNWYMGSEYKNILGKTVKILDIVHSKGIGDVYILTNGFTATPFMILRKANKELEPECFI